MARHGEPLHQKGLDHSDSLRRRGRLGHALGDGTREYFVDRKNEIAKLAQRNSDERRGTAETKTDAEYIGHSARAHHDGTANLADQHGRRLRDAVPYERLAEVEDNVE
jgi:hypothetical protein